MLGSETLNLVCDLDATIKASYVTQPRRADRERLPNGDGDRRACSSSTELTVTDTTDGLQTGAVGSLLEKKTNKYEQENLQSLDYAPPQQLLPSRRLFCIGVEYLTSRSRFNQNFSQFFI